MRLICPPRTRRSSASASRRRSRPRKMTSPETTRPGGLIRPSNERRTVLLPEPLSPTSPTASPGWIENETSSTARTMPCCPGNWVLRPRTSSNGARSVPFDTRIQRVAQRVTKQVERQHGQRDASRWEDDQPPGAIDDEPPRVGQHIAPARVGRVDPKAEERDGTFGRDGNGQGEGGLDNQR